MRFPHTNLYQAYAGKPRRDDASARHTNGHRHGHGHGDRDRGTETQAKAQGQAKGKTYEAHYHGTSMEISIYGEGPDCSVLTNRIYTDQPTDVTAALAGYGFTIEAANTSKTILTLTRTATISHLLAILDGLPQAEGTHWLNTQPDLHHITLDDSTTGWATNRTDDTDTGVCYDTSTHNWQIC